MQRPDRGWRPGYANVVATLALFIALATGGAYAASKIGSKDIRRNAVLSKHIKRAQVKTQDIGNGAVTAPKLADGAMLTTHFARVRSDGALAGGTAVSSLRLQTGAYQLVFPESIEECAGVATTSSFPGFDLAVNRIWANVAIAVTNGGGRDPNSVIVDTYGSNGLGDDTAFSLLLACP